MGYDDIKFIIKTRDIIVLRLVIGNNIIDRIIQPIGFDENDDIIVFEQYKKVYNGSTFHEIIDSNIMEEIELRPVSTINQNIEKVFDTLEKNGYKIIYPIKFNRDFNDDIFTIPIEDLVFHYKRGLYE